MLGFISVRDILDLSLVLAHSSTRWLISLRHVRGAADPGPAAVAVGRGSHFGVVAVTTSNPGRKQTGSQVCGRYRHTQKGSRTDMMSSLV